jgi:hypothetical protein
MGISPREISSSLDSSPLESVKRKNNGTALVRPSRRQKSSEYLAGQSYRINSSRKQPHHNFPWGKSFWKQIPSQYLVDPPLLHQLEKFPKWIYLCFYEIRRYDYFC